jgi:hypothetical protein
MIKRFPARVTAAIILYHDIEEFFCTREAAKIPPKQVSEFVHRLRAAGDCLMVSTETASGIVAEWTRVCDLGAPRLPDIVMTVDPLVAYTSSLTNADLHPSDGERLAMGLAQWTAFRGNYDQLHLACSRLRRARRGMHSEDRAIDLGIALEILLSGGLNGNQELTHRLSVRGAWVLGQNPGERLDTMKALRSLYDMRSTAVHTGRISSPIKYAGRKISVFEAPDEGARLCNDLIKTIVARGEWPSWDNVIMGG